MKTHLFKIRLRGGTNKTFSISKMSDDMTKTVKKCKSFQCGLSGWFSKNILDVPEVFKKMFDWECDKHDLGFERGGGILDFTESNLNLIKITHNDFWKFVKYNNSPIVNKITKILVLLLMLEIMVLLLFFIGIWAFQWGQYKTFNEIIKKRCYN